jgi:hypothetical protein
MPFMPLQDIACRQDIVRLQNIVRFGCFHCSKRLVIIGTIGTIAQIGILLRRFRCPPR